MVFTKENVAAHAVSEHLVSLQMSDCIQDKMGRLVGHCEQTGRDLTLHLTYFPPIRTRPFDRSHFSLDVEAFNKNVVSNSLTG